MSEIIIKDDCVEMTIKYHAEFKSESEMIEAVKGAAELRGLMPVTAEPVKPEE